MAKKVQLGDHRLLAAREVLRYSTTIARAAEHVRDVSRAFDFRTLSFVEGIMKDVRSIENIARRQLHDLDDGDPGLNL